MKGVPSATRVVRRWNPARIGRDRTSSTDFTDCAYAALRYASGPKGVVQVVDTRAGAPRVIEEFSFNAGAKR